MTPDRSIANAMMEGINCLAEIASMVNEGIDSAANHSWLDTLHAMEQAFNSIQAGEVITSMTITDGQIERIRRVQEFASTWLRDGRPPNELKEQVDVLLASFGLPLAEEENEVSHDLH